MADRKRTYDRQNYIYSGGFEGNAARNIQPMPQPEREWEPRRQQPKKQLSRNARRNRERALQMDVKYVVFLAVIAVAAVLVCFRYLSIQAEITAMGKNITSLESELESLKTENDTEYNSIADSVDLDEVRRVAQEELGMVPATEDQIILYKSKNDEYVKQYEEVPKSGTVE